MPSHRNQRERKRLAYIQSIEAALSADRRRRKGDRGAHAILQTLPRRHPRGERIRCAAAELAAAVRRTPLLDPRQRFAQRGPRAEDTYAFGLGQLLLCSRKWVRPPQEWRPRSHNARRQFSSLARHLLCRFDPPICMDSCWFALTGRERQAQQMWFKHVGRGGNIRKAPDLPVNLSRRAAHAFANEAPDHLDVMSALRWSQWRALGAGARLLDALLATRMAMDVARDQFWQTVVLFFVEHPMLDRAQVGPLVDFIDHQRHELQDDGRPLQPNFTMRGRTPGSLIRQMENWHRELRDEGYLLPPAVPSWKPCGIPGFARTEGEGKNAVHYRIGELLTAAALRDEGRAMSHCVASYARSCARGGVAIFSLIRRDRIGAARRLTIEVLPARRQIVQARGRFNQRATPDDLRILQAWCQNARLTLATYV